MMSNKNDTTAPFEAGEAWEQRYTDNSTRWERGDLNPAFIHWHDEGRFKECKSVIVPGCGRSPEPMAFAQMGMAVSALDFAPTAMAFQKEAFAKAGLTAQIEAADVLTWQPGSPVDALYDQTCLCALTPTVWQDYANQIHRWVKPGGKAFMLFMQTGKEGGPPFHSPLERMQKIFDAARWDWPDAPAFNAEHSSEKVELGVILTRR
ncbi:MAG: thiopurine S-methyltransferase [Robiginitomaculum sp.]|nr:MAG: thiopurine S-methyltransferase [Robiginitomaculum sp.]